MSNGLSLEEELLADLRMTRQVLEERGHTKAYLIKDNGEGSVCMTGAAGIAVIGSEFIDWVRQGHSSATGENFPGWTPRAARLLEALGEFAPTNVGGRRPLIRWIKKIVYLNDQSTDQVSALAWVDKAIEKAEKAVAEAGYMAIEDEMDE